MPRRSPLAIGTALAAIALGGCGDVLHHTRSVPIHDEFGWGPEILELPWKPPALGDRHYPRPAIDDANQSVVIHPGAGIHYDVGWGEDDPHRSPRAISTRRKMLREADEARRGTAGR